MQQQILVIEDEKSAREIYLDCLEIKGFEGIGASSGSQGLQLAKQLLPSLIICEIRLPGMDGYEVLLALHQDPKTAVIPLVFLSAECSLVDIRRGMRLGADDYITKPSTLEDFMSVVQVQIKKRSQLKSFYEASFRTDTAEDIASSTLQHSSIEVTLDDETDTFNQTDKLHFAVDDLSTDIFPLVGGQPQLVFTFIEANYKESITLADVAKAVGYSPAYLTSQVGELTGRTVNRWIIERRMAEARSLLKSTNHKVEVIAEMIGYQNTCHFSRQFRKHHAQPPNTWRTAQSLE